MTKPHDDTHSDRTAEEVTSEQHGRTEPVRHQGVHGLLRRYRLVVLAVVVGLVMVGGSLVYAKTIGSNPSGDFDPRSVLSQSGEGAGPAGTEQFDATSIKQYDGKDGHECYVAVDGVVYEIPQQGQWKDGKHSPSSGQAYCGADMSQAIGKSPHGKSKLQELRKVGTYK